ncbi:hypothetical protein QYE76_045282 [Lolium multiflorum]|uniref:Uncharacterized protein n=1 Tax=Lolium multiflorum TaxID=4521 RepID=A0AAD8TMN1_LOLMU|nr:hypothetical protein QYE76_045282 [Lolium multiflorum]
MQALKVLEQNSHDSRNRALGMTKGSNLALAVNSVEEVIPQESYRASWSMSYPDDLEHHYHDHMAFHANSFWVDPSKAKEDNIKRNNSRGFTSSGPRTRSCYNCDDKRHFIAECPYENRENHGGRLIPKDKSKDSKGKYSKAPKKKFYNNKTKKGKRPSKVVLVTREEYSSDEVESSSDDEDEESSKEVDVIVTTNIPSSSLFESPNESPHIKNAHCFMARSSLDTSIVLSTQEEYTSGDDDVDDEEDATSNGLVSLASLSTNSSSSSESPNEVIHVEEESCLMAKSSEVAEICPSALNIARLRFRRHRHASSRVELAIAFPAWVPARARLKVRITGDAWTAASARPRHLQTAHEVAAGDDWRGGSAPAIIDDFHDVWKPRISRRRRTSLDEEQHRHRETERRLRIAGGTSARRASGQPASPRTLPPRTSTQTEGGEGDEAGSEEGGPRTTEGGEGDEAGLHRRASPGRPPLVRTTPLD